jgi:pilus assembly protein CpaB
MLRSLRRRLPRLGRTPRLLAAGLCLLLALISALGAHAAAPATARTLPVVVAARDLPAGHRLAAADLRVARWPAALRPGGVLSRAAPLVGRRTAGPLQAREAVTATRVLGNGLLTGLAAGSLAAAVPLADPHAADLIRAGDLVDLVETPRPVDTDLAPASHPPVVTTVATRVLVLAVLPHTADADSEAILAVDRPTALRIASQAASAAAPIPNRRTTCSRASENSSCAAMSSIWPLRW